MSLARMALTNYRCFAKRLDIELRPVTVVLGRNNSGKSALVRAPLVFSTGFRTDSPAPLDLDLLGEEILDSFTDLIYGGRPHGSIRIELEFDEEGEAHPALLDATVQNVDEYHLQIISSLSMQVEESKIRLEWEQNDPRSCLRPCETPRTRERSPRASSREGVPGKSRSLLRERVSVSDMYEFIDAEKDAVTDTGEKKYTIVCRERREEKPM